MSFFIPTAATGNGRILATVGRAGELMGFFYPRLDYAQNVREGMPAVRLSGAGYDRFCWCFEDMWRVAQSFERSSNVLVTRWAHREVDVTFELLDVTLPGEPMVEFGLRIEKAVADRAVPVVVGYANGNVGYICTDRAHQEGGYEPGHSASGPGAEKVLVAESLRLADAVIADVFEHFAPAKPKKP